MFPPIKRITKNCCSIFFPLIEIQGLKESSPAADWWSLGAILFELLSGEVSPLTLSRCLPCMLSMDRICLFAFATELYVCGSLTSLSRATMS